MNSGHVTSQSLNCFLPRIVVHASPRSSATFWPYGEKSNIALLAKWAVQTQDNIITYVRKGIRTNENRGKQCKTHGKYRTVANMQSKSKVYIFRPFTFTDLGPPPPPPPRVWKIGILQEIRGIASSLTSIEIIVWHPGKSSQLSHSPNIPFKRHTYYHGRTDAYHSRHCH